MTKIASINKTYGDAGEYAGMYDSPLCRAEDHQVAGLISKLIPEQSYSMLDIGSGDAMLVKQLEKEGLKLPTEYVGVDLARALLVQGNNDLNSNGFNRLTNLFVLADMMQLPIKENTFDLVASTYGPFSYVGNVDNATSLAKDINRILKPGGKGFIMPYTHRLGGIDVSDAVRNFLNGQSTAYDHMHEKLYFTDELAHKVFDPIFDHVEVYGLNFLGFPVESIVNELRKNKIKFPLPGETFLELEKRLIDSLNIPTGNYRHMVITFEKR